MADTPPLVAEAMKKSGLVWITVPGAERAVAAWHLWRDDAAYLVTGPAEQPVPGLADAPTCDVTVRSTDKGGRIVTWQAGVSRLDPGGDEWDAVLPALTGARLNLTDADAAAERWATTCAVLRLTPTGVLTEAGPSLPDGSLAAPPPPVSARTVRRLPFTIGRRRQRVR